MKMKLREYFHPSKCQTYTRISAPLYDNVSYKINPHMLQLLPTLYGRFNDKPYEFLEVFTNISVEVFQEHLNVRIFPLELKDKAREWFKSVGQEFTS